MNQPPPRPKWCAPYSYQTYCKLLYGLYPGIQYPTESTAPKTQVVHSLILYGLYPDVHAAGYGLYPDESTCPKTKVVRSLIRRVRWDTALDGIPLRPVPR